jgi:diadenosine tetraphosphate (Ap4A) HIT family hydrolase
MPTTNCDFCNEFCDNAENTFRRIYGLRPNSRVLFRSEEFVVVPSLGQIVEGYLLLVPTKHWTALGDLSESLLGELADLCQSVAAILRKEYGSCVLYEHGTRSASAGGCGIYHAHLHAVPSSKSLDQSELLKSKFSYSEIVDLNDIRSGTEHLPAYLFYQNPQGRSYVFDTGSLPSQYMRRLLAEELGNPEWDWRSAGREERLLNTLNRLSDHFDSVRIPLGSQKMTHGTPR